MPREIDRLDHRSVPIAAGALLGGDPCHRLVEALPVRRAESDGNFRARRERSERGSEFGPRRQVPCRCATRGDEVLLGFDQLLNMQSEVNKARQMRAAVD